MVAMSAAFVGLSDMQADVVRFIAEFWSRNNYAPSVRDICDQFDLGPTAIVAHLTQLHRGGVIAWERNQNGTIRVLESARN